ncbi:hypothetical protein JCM33374_g2391 [Metschnikowia sp. JCM 33374]|nr:hypothetical protein JCM33374_g2391 [Metschnikowia sp. JCM 33374]
MDYYQPTSLFRHNAIRRTSSSYGDDTDSQGPFSSPSGSNNSSSWLLHHNQLQDTPVMNKACSLDRVNIKSNYWKIPDTEMNLTALALNDSTADSPLLAISSANTHNNLFIHELDSVNHYLTHHTTISLPNIHGLAWVPNANSRFLISGNNKGYAHLVSVPRPSHYDGSESGEESAEIVKRFNHRKHLKMVNKDPSIFSHASTCISELGFLSDTQLVTCYDDTLFVWNMNNVESSMRPKPESISVVTGIRSFDPSTSNKSTLALCGAFGVSLFDTRTAQHSVPKSSLSSKPNLNQMMTKNVKWHPTNEHLLASSQADGIVRLWDIRKDDTFAELTGHSGKSVTSMSWNGNDLFTGASDGNIVHWDLTSNLDAHVDLSSHGDKLSRCCLREGIDSVAFDTVSNSIIERVNERQCGTTLPASNNKIIGICPIVGSGPQETCNVLSIDGAAFLGLHCKIYDAAYNDVSSSEKHFYTQEDINLIKQEGSKDSLISSSDSLIRPLSVVRKATSFTSDGSLENSSDTTAVSLEERRKSWTHATALAIAETTSALENDDFNFNPNPEEFLGSAFVENAECKSAVVSLHSVESSSDLNISPYSAGMSNHSTTSLSTIDTLIGHSEPVIHKDLQFNSFDVELERLCEAFPGRL